jgi:hypothetical protein
MIRQFLRNLRISLQSTRYIQDPEWTAEDERILAGFLASATGTRFRAKLRNLVLRHNASAVVVSKDLHYECGFANGFRGCINAIEALVPPPPSQEGITDASELDHLSP